MSPSMVGRPYWSRDDVLFSLLLFSIAFYFIFLDLLLSSIIIGVLLDFYLFQNHMISNVFVPAVMSALLQSSIYIVINILFVFFHWSNF